MIEKKWRVVNGNTGEEYDSYIDTEKEAIQIIDDVENQQGFEVSRYLYWEQYEPVKPKEKEYRNVSFGDADGWEDIYPL